MTSPSSDTDDARGSLHTSSEPRAVDRDQEHHWTYPRVEAEERSIAKSRSAYTIEESSRSGHDSVVESVFEWDAGSGGHSSAGPSPAPSLFRRNRRRLELSGRQHDNHDPDYFLWCEFGGLLGCKTTFPGSKEADWIQHHVDHFLGVYPRRLVCWFCDDHTPFEVSTDAMYSFADLKENFDLRMRHIKEHISSDYFTLDHMRPDFHMIRHMHQYGLVDDSTFQMAMSYTELPRSLQLPSNEDDRSQLSCAVVGHYDLEKEERHWRRRKRNYESAGSFERSVLKQASGMNGSKKGRKYKGVLMGMGQMKKEIEEMAKMSKALISTRTSEGARVARAPRVRQDVAVVSHGRDGVDLFLRGRKDLLDNGDDPSVSESPNVVQVHFRTPPQNLDDDGSTMSKGKETERIQDPESDKRRRQGVAILPLGSLLAYNSRKTSLSSRAPLSTSEEQPLSRGSLDSELLSISEGTASVAELDPESPLHQALLDVTERVVRGFYFRQDNFHREAPQYSSAGEGSRPVQTCPQQTTSSAGSASGSGVQKRRRKGDGTGRERGQDSNEDDEDNQAGRNPEKRPRTEDPQVGSRSLACPFWKRSPFDKHRKCHRYKLSRIRDVKLHLTRKHTPSIYCQKCFQIFDAESDLDSHIERDACRRVPGSQLDGITPATDRALRRRADKDQSIEDQWFTMWDIIFPGKQRPFSPFVDTALSTDLCNFREYFENHEQDTWDEVDASLERVREQNMSDEDRRANRRRVMIMGMDRIYENWVASQSRVLLESLSSAGAAPPSVQACLSPVRGTGRRLRTGVSPSRQDHQPAIPRRQEPVVPINAPGRTGSTTDGGGDTSSGTSRTDPEESGQCSQKPGGRPSTQQPGPCPALERLNFSTAHWTDEFLSQQQGFHLPGGDQRIVSFDALFGTHDLPEQEGTFCAEFNMGFHYDETFDGG